MELAIIRSKTFKKIIFWGLIAVLVLAAIGVIFYFQRTGRINQLLSGLLGRIALKEKTPPPPPEETPSEKLEEKFVPPTPKVYEEVAGKGEGITHLARKALKEYLAKTNTGKNLTPEHKIFIEDYLKDKTGDYWLKPGDKISFSEELISQAINKALQLSPQQLQNLHQYSVLVPGL